MVKVLLYSVKNCEDSESVAYLKYNKLACHNFVGAGKKKKNKKQINMIFLDQRPRALLLWPSKRHEHQHVCIRLLPGSNLAPRLHRYNTDGHRRRPVHHWLHFRTGVLSLGTLGIVQCSKGQFPQKMVLCFLWIPWHRGLTFCIFFSYVSNRSEYKLLIYTF